MTRLQKEVNRLILQKGCTTRYDEKTGDLNIDYQGKELLTLPKDGLICYDTNNQKTEQRKNMFYGIADLIHKAIEYVSLYECAPQMKAESVQHYRRLAKYNGIVLAGMHDDTHGYMFTTWIETNDQNYVIQGDYSRNYDYVKEVFVTRSGLIDEQKLFSNEQLGLLRLCLEYTLENNENMTYDQERNMDALRGQIGEIIAPETAAEEQEQSLQQNM